MVDVTIETQKEHILRIIDDFRKDFDTLDDFERNFIAPQNLFTNPCQIEIFWVSEPIEFQMLVLFHNPNRQDKEIVINGPFKAGQIAEKVIEIMDEPRWKEKAPINTDTWDFPTDVGGREQKYSDEFAGHFYDFLHWINQSSAQSHPLGFVSGQILGSTDMCFFYRGNVTNIPLDELNQKSSIESARKMAADKRLHKTEVIPDSPTPVVKKRKFFGAYFTPGVRIGDYVELSYREKVFGPDTLQYPKYEYGFNFQNRMGFFDRYGLVLIENEDEEGSIKAINLVFAVSLIQGIDVFSVRKSDIVQSEIPFDKNPLGKPLGSYSKKISDVTGNAPNFLGRIRSTQIPFDKMETILNLSNQIFLNERLSESLIFLLESNTHLKNSEFSQAFIFCWLIVEQNISQIFSQLLSDNPEVRSKIKKGKNIDRRPISDKIKILHGEKRIDDQNSLFLIDNNSKRNELVHSGKTISKQDAEELFKFAFSLVNTRIKNEIIPQ